MAKPGPTAKPVELKVIEGNRGHRALNLDSTFRPEAGLPPIPKDLSAGARKVWRRLGQELLRYNLISVVYSDTFEDLCESIADVKLLRHSLRRRQALLAAEGKDPAEAFECQTPGGMPVQHPRYQVLKSERQMMHSLLAKFGLTPAEQAGVTTAIRAQLKLFDEPAAGSPAAPNAEPRGAPRGFSEFE
jgi:P27 family predicted phage terminase small subunit